MSIIIGADIVPVALNEMLFEKSKVEELIGCELQKILIAADYRIFNLEVPITDTKMPIEKHGRNLIAPSKCMNGIKAIGIDLFTLANNHIMDQGDQGLESTIKLLDSSGIAHVGAGRSIGEASKPYFLANHGTTYGIYACAEHEFSIATDNKPGANPFDPLESIDHVENMKKNCDYAIVLYHGGKEQYRYPSPYLQKVCRKLVEKGADLVVCQHSHCIGCKEEYGSGTIVYGQGNFLFSQWDNEYWNTGLLLNIITPGKIEYIPVVRTNTGARMAEDEEKTHIMDDFETRSNQIMIDGFIEKNYDDFVSNNITDYLVNISGGGYKSSTIFRIMNKLSRNSLKKQVASKYKKRAGLLLRNYIECEAHRDIIIRGLS